MPETGPAPLNLPAPTERGRLKVPGGEERAWARWNAAAPIGKVVLSHGYGEHGERYAHIAAWLTDLGWAVSAMDHKGFGRSEGIRGDAHGLAPFADDLALFLAQERLPGLPLVVLGHSFGALVALAAAAEHPGAADGLILSSPALVLRGYPPSVRLIRWLLLRLAPHMSLELPNNKDLVCSDPELVRRYWADPLCHRQVSAAYTEIFPDGFRMLQDRAAALTCPMLVLEAGDDTVADPDAGDPFWSLISPQLLERHRLDGFLHEVFHDLRRQEAQNLAAAWLTRHFETPPGNPEAVPAMRG